ncbi:ABC transporter permease [Embleya scabrispora]|uniref:ABC transporter permease n=1 Tax=Embleya scabrispora TaxID=159449 RepID=A0A1T3NL32_9ACTN|nr:FtsX-like permease family protein [Embleya scabrispora]OPC77589.1 ABC transporter permease [Embleya scabrispora]
MIGLGGALGRVVRSGVSRRRVQTVVIALATMMAVASAVVAGSLVVAANAPFDHAFAHQHGAHLSAQFDPGRVGAADLAATGHLTGVTVSAGPYPTATMHPTDGRGGHFPALTVAGRAGPHAAVDDLDLTSGRWAEKPGEIVLSTEFAGPDMALGSTLTGSDAPGAPILTVVGVARSVSRTAGAWVTPDQVAALASTNEPAGSQMLYRFAAAGTDGKVAERRAEIESAVPAGAFLGARSHLDTKRAADGNAAPTIPFLTAFGVLGIAMSVIIVGSVVSGAVGTGLRRIGILKAIGFTPREVVRAYVAQALVPAAVGIGLGVVLGNLMALPLLADTEQLYDDTSLSVAWWVDVLVAVGALVVVGVAALVPALRAGRLRTIEAIAVGRAPRTGRGRWAYRVTGRLPLPRALTYGLASPFAHPVRSLAMVLAVVFGTVAATFAVGLTASLNAVGDAQDPENRAAVTVIAGGAGGPGGAPAGGAGPGVNAGPAGGNAPAGGAGPGGGNASAGGGPSPADSARIRDAVVAAPGTATSYGMASVDVTVTGIPGAVRAALYQGDSRPGGYPMIAGHWLDGPGQVVVPTRFLARTGTRIGDTIRVTHQGDAQGLRIVGEAFDTSDDGTRIHADMASFASARPDVYLIGLKPGVSRDRYATDLARVVEPLGGAVLGRDASSGRDGLILVLDAMAALLTLMLVAVAGLGVLNSVVLDTRERVHDLGVCKALGMTPRQTVGLVLASVVGIGVAGGLIGVPVGYALHGYVVPRMGHAAGTNLPPSVLDVYDLPELTLLGLAGVAIAALGALLPATWAARTRTATALRTE